MTSKKKIAAELQSALSEQKPLSADLYSGVLAEYEVELNASLNRDADDALLCVLVEDGEVAIMLIDWDGSIYRNSDALKKLKVAWQQSFEKNMQILIPLFSSEISQGCLGVAGIKWLIGPSE